MVGLQRVCEQADKGKGVVDHGGGGNARAREAESRAQCTEGFAVGWWSSWRLRETYTFARVLLTDLERDIMFLLLVHA